MCPPSVRSDATMCPRPPPARAHGGRNPYAVRKVLTTYGHSCFRTTSCTRTKAPYFKTSFVLCWGQTILMALGLDASVDVAGGDMTPTIAQMRYILTGIAMLRGVFKRVAEDDEANLFLPLVLCRHRPGCVCLCRPAHRFVCLHQEYSFGAASTAVFHLWEPWRRANTAALPQGTSNCTDWCSEHLTCQSLP
jgi:hypothetical protein